jgi:hypothetical protein
MIRIHVARNRRSIGQYSPEDIAEGLQTGEFLPTDLAWREPMESWKPLAEFDDLPVVEAPMLTPPSLPVETGALAEPIEPAWERRESMGSFRALFQTVQQVFSVPVTTFKVMKCEGGLGGPLWFYTILLSLTTWASIFYQIVALKVNPDAVLGTLATQISPTEMEGGLYLLLLLSPVFVAAGVFVTAGVVHAMFMTMGCAKKPFEATFRGVCYAMAPASLFQLIPTACGGAVYFVAGLVLLTIALREIHQTDTMRAVAGVMLPALVCCGLLVGFYTTMAALAVSGGLVK